MEKNGTRKPAELSGSCRLRIPSSLAQLSEEQSSAMASLAAMRLGRPAAVRPRQVSFLGVRLQGRRPLSTETVSKDASKFTLAVPAALERVSTPGFPAMQWRQLTSDRAPWSSSLES